MIIRSLFFISILLLANMRALVRPAPVAPASFGRIINVSKSGNKDFASIQEAISVAKSGDVVKVAPGTYDEALNMKDGVNVVGSGKEVTFIQTKKIQSAFPRFGKHPIKAVIIFNNVKSGELKGVSIKYTGSEKGTNIIGILNSSPTIKDTLITGATLDGINLSEANSNLTLTLENSKIFMNGGGVCIEGGSATIANNKIEKNGYYGIVFVYAWESSVLIRNSIASNKGAGVKVFGPQRGLIRIDQNIIRENLFGIEIDRVESSDRLLITNNIIAANKGDGVKVSDGYCKINQNTIKENSDGISIDNKYLPPHLGSLNLEDCNIIENNTIVANKFSGVNISARDEIVTRDYIDVILSHNIISYNKGWGIRSDTFKKLIFPLKPTLNTHCSLDHNLLWENGWNGEVNYDGVADHSNDLYMDPLFIDPKKGNFDLAPDSPAFTAGRAGRVIGNIKKE